MDMRHHWIHCADTREARSVIALKSSSNMQRTVRQNGNREMEDVTPKWRVPGSCHMYSTPNARMRKRRNRQLRGVGRGRPSSAGNPGTNTRRTSPRPPSVSSEDGKPRPVWLWSQRNGGARSSGERGRRARAFVTRGERELDPILGSGVLDILDLRNCALIIMKDLRRCASACVNNE